MDEQNNNIVLTSKKADNQNMTYYQKKPAPMKPPESQYDILFSSTAVTYPTNEAVLVYKSGSNWIGRNSNDGSIISSNTDFSTVMNAVSAWITGNGIIFIKDPGTNIVPTATITFTNKEVFVSSDYAKIDFSALNDVVFHFLATGAGGFLQCGISNFRLKGDPTKTNSIFCKFTGMRARVDNLIATDPDFLTNFVTLVGGCYNSSIERVQGQAVLCIDVKDDGTYNPNGIQINHCDLYPRSTSTYVIKLVNGFDMSITNCYIENLAGTANTLIYASGVEDLFITGNYINLIYTVGIDVSAATNHNVVIKGNYFNCKYDGSIGVKT
jgi:hypothetical protein